MLPTPLDSIPRVLAALALVPALALGVAGHGGQNPPPSPQERQVPTFTSGVNLVEVYATVLDPSGAPTRGLTADAFELREDGEVQVITAFAAGTFPLSVALAIDRSASMAGQSLALAKAAGRAFLAALRPDDQAMILAVSSEVDVVAPLSDDRQVLQAAIESLRPWSTTALHDAVIAGIDRIQPARGRRALILVSDGQDRYSEATAAAAVAHARRSDVLVYPIAVGERQVPPLFVELAAVSGGRSYAVRDPRRLAGTLEAIAGELRLQYLLGYVPTRAPQQGAEPEWRSIQVKVNRPGVTVRARDGYLAK